MRLRRPTAALLRYALGWGLAGAVVATALVLLLRATAAPELRPLQQVELRAAARAAGCRLQPSAVPERDPARPVPAGVFDEPVPEGSAVAAVRRGLVVVTYRRELEEEDRQRLEVLQKVVPRGTVLAPEGAAAEGAMRVRAWRRTLACPRVDDRTIEAARFFRGRYIGRRP